MVSGVFGNIPVFAGPHDEARQAVVGLSIAATALAAIWIQYALRRVIPARVIVVSGALVSALLFGLLLRAGRVCHARHGIPGTAAHLATRRAL
jgi:hypothetical protein